MPEKHCDTCGREVETYPLAGPDPWGIGQSPSHVYACLDCLRLAIVALEKRTGDRPALPEGFDVTNRWMVATGSFDCWVVFLRPPAARQIVTRLDALNLVAWVCTIAELSREDVEAARRAVERT